MTKVATIPAGEVESLIEQFVTVTTTDDPNGINESAIMCLGDAFKCAEWFADGEPFPGKLGAPWPQSYEDSASMWLKKAASYQWGYATPEWWPLKNA